MEFKFEKEARNCLDEISLSCSIPKSKEDIRRIMSGRKRDVIIKNHKQWVKIENQALKLLRVVNYEDIEPTLILCGQKYRKFWFFFRSVLSSAPFTGGPGRWLPFLCMDKKSAGVMGVAELRSDLIALGPRDKAIGWSKKAKFRLFRLNNIGALATCVCSTPFGLLTGGKYIAVAVISNDITRLWQHRYKNILAAITTTSLYGKSSQYNRLKEWEYVGLTPGRGSFQISKEQHGILKEFINRNYLIARQSGYAGKWDVLNKCCGVLHYNMKNLESNQPRGTYISWLGEKSRELLRGDIDISDFIQEKRNLADISQWWKERWHSMRLPKKIDEIKSFDYHQYSLKAQLRQCEEMICATSKDSVVPGVQSGEGGASPTVALKDKGKNTIKEIKAKERIA